MNSPLRAGLFKVLLRNPSFVVLSEVDDDTIAIVGNHVEEAMDQTGRRISVSEAVRQTLIEIRELAHSRHTPPGEGALHLAEVTTHKPAAA